MSWARIWIGELKEPYRVMALKGRWADIDAAAVREISRTNRGVRHELTVSQGRKITVFTTEEGDLVNAHPVCVIQFQTEQDITSVLLTANEVGDLVHHLASMTRG